MSVFVCGCKDWGRLVLRNVHTLDFGVVRFIAFRVGVAGNERFCTGFGSDFRA